MKHLISLFLLPLSIPVFSYSQQPNRYKNALAGAGNVFLFSGTPYLSSLNLAGIKYERLFSSPDKSHVFYLVTGIQAMIQVADTYIAMPLEICIGTRQRIVSIHCGAGGIIHTGGTYLQPAIFLQHMAGCASNSDDCRYSLIWNCGH